MTSFPSTAAASASPIWVEYGCRRRCVLRASSSPLPSPGWRTGGLSASPSLPMLSPCVPLKTKARPDHTPIPKGLRLLISGNAKKARFRLSKLHARIANIRQDALHKLRSDLTQRFHPIAIEELNVRGMLKNHRLARSIADIWISSSFADNWNTRQKGVVVWCLSLVAGFRPARAVRHGERSRKHCRWPFASGCARSVEASTAGR